MTDFYTLWTDTGLTKLGNATLEIPFNMITAVVGDGNGAGVIPNKGQIDLVNQVWSGVIGSKVRSQSDPNTIVFEVAIPAADGPFTVREVGLKTDDGQLCIVGNFPVTEKPVATDGSVRDMILRIPVHFENADVVSLVIDPNIVTATKAELLAHGLKQLDPTDADPVKERHLSNLQANKWEKHLTDPLLHMGRNILINGGFDIWQRGVFFTPVARSFSADRWMVNIDGSIARSDIVPPEAGCCYSAVLNTNGLSSVTLLQGIELPKPGCGGFFSTTNKVTIGFWHKADVEGKTIGASLSFKDWVGTSSNTVLLFTENFTTTSTGWEFVSKTFTLPGVNPVASNKSAQLAIVVDGDPGNFHLANIQLEAGEVATDFERRLPGVELALCQRYYHFFSSIYLYSNTVSTVDTVRVLNIPRAVPMRVSPSESGATNYGTLSFLGTSDRLHIMVSSVLQPGDGGDDNEL